MSTRIQLRRDTADNWQAIDPVLADGEAGYDKSNNEIRVGDGVSSWSELDPVFGQTTDGGAYSTLFRWAATDAVVGDGEVMLASTQSDLSISTINAEGIDVTSWLNRDLIAGTVVRITSVGDKNRTLDLRITLVAGEVSGAISTGCELLSIKKLPVAGEVVNLALTPPAAVPQFSSSAVGTAAEIDELRLELERARAERDVLEFQLRSVFSVLSKTAQGKLRGVFPEGGNRQAPRTADGGHY